MKLCRLFVLMVAAFGMLNASVLGDDIIRPPTFTYQGELRQGGLPVTGDCELTFELFGMAVGGSQIGPTNGPMTVTVVDGIFTVQLDFGVDPAFCGERRWLEISVCCPSPCAAGGPLAPRQELTPSPYAVSLPALKNTVSDNAAFPDSPNLIGGHHDNIIEAGSAGAVIVGGGGAGNLNNNRASGLFPVVGGGLRNAAGGEYVTVAGGESNGASGSHATVGGGENNVAGGSHATVGGGENNRAGGLSSTIGGGSMNIAAGFNSTIGGGINNLVSNAGTIGGGNTNDASGFNSTVSGGADNTASGTSSAICGGTQNIASGRDAVIGGGLRNEASHNATTVAGGEVCTATEHGATVGGGTANNAIATRATVGGGINNIACAIQSTIGGGTANIANGASSTVGGGAQNIACGIQATVGGGISNIASGLTSTVPGGVDNEAVGESSFAAGRQAKANFNGMFVWGDNIGGLDFPSATEANFVPAANQFLAKAGGGVVFVSSVNAAGDSVTGVQLPAGGGAWAALSDRNVKENVKRVDEREVLERLSKIPVSTWNYKSQDESIRHIGPMAQDLYAAFGVGENEKMITTVDADGVALAAIQGLHQIVKKKDVQITALEARLTALETTIAAKAQVK